MPSSGTVAAPPCSTPPRTALTVAKACGFARASVSASSNRAMSPVLIPSAWSPSSARTSAISTSVKSVASVKSCMSATLGGVSPCAQRRSGARRWAGQPSSHATSPSRGRDMAFRAAELTTPVPTINRAPFVFVGLLAAQKMECARALRQGLLDGMRDNDGAGAFKLIRGIEAGQISVGLPVVRQTVVDSRDGVADAQHIETQQTLGLQRRRGIALKVLHRIVCQHARLAAAFPAGSVQAEEMVERRADRRRIGLLDGYGATARGAVARHVDFASLGFRENIREVL